MENKKTIAFKGFDKNFKCRGYQFEVGHKYEHEGDVRPCRSGFHACENPFDVWSYYGPFESRFAEVVLSGKQEKHDEDSKIAAAKIEIKAELTIGEFVPKAVKWIIGHCKIKGGDKRVQSSSGDSAQIGSSGYYARIGSSGDSARIGSSGYYARIKAEGENSVIASAGYGAIVRGAQGTWISVAEYKGAKCVGFATGCIGKDGLKPDVDYKAKGGKLVPVEEGLER